MTDIADKGAERRWREMGAANQTDAKSALVQSMRRSIGIEAVRGHARLKLDRLAQMTGDMNAGAERRSNSRFGTNAYREAYEQRHGPRVWQHGHYYC